METVKSVAMTAISRIETIRLDIPFGDRYDGPRAKPRGWMHCETFWCGSRAR